MKKVQSISAFIFLFLTPPTTAQDNSVNVNEKTGSGEKTIIIKKGAQDTRQTVFEIVSGKSDIMGDPDMSFKKARTSWKQACNSWKSEMKELNKNNRLLVLNCNRPKREQEGTLYVYSSTGSYKMKVKVKE